MVFAIYNFLNAFKLNNYSIIYENKIEKIEINILYRPPTSPNNYSNPYIYLEWIVYVLSKKIFQEYIVILSDGLIKF